MATILTNSGRALISALIQSQDLYMGFGEGLDHWNTNREQVETFSEIDNTIDLGYTEIQSVVVTHSDEEIGTIFVEGVDYTVNTTTGIVTKIPAGSIGSTMVKIEFFVKSPTPLLTATALIDMLGAKKITNKQFVTPDVAGEIIVPGGGRYTLSIAPTKFLFLSCTLLEEELSTAVIREVTVFANPTFLLEPAEGDYFFEPADFDSLGTMLTLRNYSAITRNEASREVFQLILPL